MVIFRIQRRKPELITNAKYSTAHLWNYSSFTDCSSFLLPNSWLSVYAFQTNKLSFEEKKKAWCNLFIYLYILQVLLEVYLIARHTFPLSTVGWPSLNICSANQETGFTGDIKASPWADKRETANFLTFSSASLKLRAPGRNQSLLIGCSSRLRM